MAEILLNNFLLGADPEMILLDPPTLIRGNGVVRPNKGLGAEHFYGFDHNGFVIEPHPMPSFSVKALCSNMKDSLAAITYHYPNYKQRAGAYHESDQRPVTLGGHVHLDLKTLTPVQITAMDNFCTSLENLDILPSTECQKRTMVGRPNGYGKKGDIRSEHGHVEYRSMCSWLFSRKTAMLSITGIKLAACAPGSITVMKSIKELQTWLEHFKGKDDDVDWILNKEYLKDSMEAKPDNDIAKIWKVDPKIGEAVIANKLKELEEQKKKVYAHMHGQITNAFLEEVRIANNQYTYPQRQLAAEIRALRLEIEARIVAELPVGVQRRSEALRVAKLLETLQ